MKYLGWVVLCVSQKCRQSLTVPLRRRCSPELVHNMGVRSWFLPEAHHAYWDRGYQVEQ